MQLPDSTSLATALPADLITRLPRGSGLPTADDRAHWKTVAAERPALVAGIIAEAEAALATPVPDLPLAGLAAFWPTGDRVRHETPYFARRRRLGALALAEAITAEGRYLDAIAEHLWAIISEPLWVLPAHAGYRRGAMDQSAWIDPVPAPGWEGVDLFAAETAQVLAECVELLRTPLERRSRSLIDWVQRAVIERVVQPVAAAEPWDATTPETKWRRWPWWIFAPRNNWTPWCSAGVLAATLLCDDDRTRASAVVRRLVGALDGYLASQPADGACDEGPSYWNVACGQVLVALELLADVLPARVWQAPVLHAQARYPLAVHVGGRRFATIADARPDARPRQHLLWRWGTHLGDDGLQRLAAALPDDALEAGTGSALLSWRRTCAWQPAQRPAAVAVVPSDSWLAGVQVLVRRAAGVALVVKGGHNDENHNHNDLGHVAVAVDGQPLLVDVGIGAYGRATFGPERYTSWLTRGAGHNAAVINGVEQVAGAAYAASAQRLDDGLALDLTRAYPTTARIESYHRTAQMDATGAIRIEEHLRLPGAWTAEFTLYTPAGVTVQADGALLHPAQGQGWALRLEGGLALVAVEEQPLDDPLLMAGYGPLLRRLVLRVAGHDTGHWTLHLRRAAGPWAEEGVC
jgi:hypothetical protein